MKTKSEIKNLTKSLKLVMSKYKEDYPDVVMDRDYFPLKLSEELGECMQSYLMYTDRGRQKGKSKKEIKIDLANELSDILGYFLLFADNENIDIESAIESKWLKYLHDEK